MDKIYLYPLGGISKFYLPLNATFKKEIIILLAGPLFQILAKVILCSIIPKHITMINFYHYGILLFNLLPVYPLDGGKLFNIFLSTFLPYLLSLKISIYISYLVIFIIFIINIHLLKLNLLILIIFLLTKVHSEKNKINLIYEKFILERYLNNYSFKNSKLIKNDRDFYKNNRHIIRYSNKYVLEKDYLIKKYKKS